MAVFAAVGLVEVETCTVDCGRRPVGIEIVVVGVVGIAAVAGKAEMVVAVVGHSQNLGFEVAVFVLADIAADWGRGKFVLVVSVVARLATERQRGSNFATAAVSFACTAAAAVEAAQTGYCSTCQSGLVSAACRGKGY